jgi:Protein of unknown function (DUF3048) N-terminal domain/Protein of unknown function (DUF3048) C-terminal domain
MMWTQQKTTVVVGSVLVLAGLVASALLVFSQGGTPVRRDAARPAPTPTPIVSRPAGPLRSPFTGERIPYLRRVLAVKIDNIVYARPQTGLGSADIVYVLPVEGGLSRFMAIFSSHYPPVIGPVRSARQDDINLLGQFGRPAFAYSGATAALLPYIHAVARIVDLYAGTASGYYRGTDRIAPYNLYAQTRALLRQARGASKAHDIGFRFGPPPPGGRPVRSVSVSYPAASFRFRWSPSQHRWLVWMDGSPAMTTDSGQLGPATVVIQHTTVRTSRFLEYGFRPPYAESTGSGTALVLRGGQEWHVHWSRSRVGHGTVFTTGTGQRMTFARGQVWVVLAGRNG